MPCASLTCEGFFRVGTVVGTSRFSLSDSHVTAALAALDQSGRQVHLAPQGDGHRLVQGLKLCALARLYGVPECRINGVKFEDVQVEKFSLIPLAGYAFSGFWILAIVETVPDPRANIELVDQNSVGASAVGHRCSLFSFIRKAMRRAFRAPRIEVAAACNLTLAAASS